MSRLNVTDLANTLALKKILHVGKFFFHKFQWEILILPMTMQENETKMNINIKSISYRNYNSFVN